MLSLGKSAVKSGTLVIRTDANGKIGSGHLARCMSIAQAAKERGGEVLFAFSDAEHCEDVRAQGFGAVVMGGDPRSLGREDGRSLLEALGHVERACLLVDSYGVSSAFFDALTDHVPVAYIDDLYLFSEGSLTRPRPWSVDAVVNYGFGVDASRYDACYGSEGVIRLIGPGYAPVGKRFRDRGYVVSDAVERVLVTCGSTNPQKTLERMIRGVRKAAPEAIIDVVVGSMAVLEDDSVADDGVILHRDVRDMSDLMVRADVAVSAAGSTLYELSCVGVPTVALPIVPNQMGNIAGFQSEELGSAHPELDWTAEDVCWLVDDFIRNKCARSVFSTRATSKVDGYGAARIASAVLAL